MGRKFEVPEQKAQASSVNGAKMDYNTDGGARMGKQPQRHQGRKTAREARVSTAIDAEDSGT